MHYLSYLMNVFGLPLFLSHDIFGLDNKIFEPYKMSWGAFPHLNLLVYCISLSKWQTNILYIVSPIKY